jgi:hypothetical protein
VLEVAQQRVVDPVGAPELGFELADALLALCSRFVVEVMGTLLEQFVRLGTTYRRQRGRLDGRQRGAVRVGFAVS